MTARFALPLSCISVLLLGATVLPAQTPNDKNTSAFVPAPDDQGARAEATLRSLAQSPFPRSGLWRDVAQSLSAYWVGENAKGDAAIAQLASGAKATVANQTAGGFHWQAFQLARIVLLFGHQGVFAPDRMSPTAEQAAKDTLWQWLAPRGARGLVDPARDWWQWGSENHHIQAWVSFWSALNVLARDQAYAARTFADGSTVRELKADFDSYFKRWLRERATHGLFVEANSPTYAKYSLSGLYNLVDFADDAELRRLSREFLDLCWTQWALEQVDGIRGGSRHRSYAGGPSIDGSSLGNLAWYHFGIGDAESRHPSVLCTITSAYQPPDFVKEIITRRAELGDYEITSRLPGLLAQTRTGEANYSTDRANPMFNDRGVSQYDPACGQLLRRTYSTPGFVIGSSLLPALPMDRWASTSSQNRWDGILFADTNAAGLFVQPPKAKKGSIYNTQWSVQDRGVLLVQRLPFTNSKGQRVWFPHGLARTEKDGWIFVDAPHAYAAVRVVQGGASWAPDEAADWMEVGDFKPGLGEWLVLADESSPIVIEVAPRSAYADAAAFQKEILQNALTAQGDRVDYRSAHYDTKLTLFSDQSKLPEINGVPLDFALKKSFAGPVLEGEGDIVRLRAFGRDHVFNFGSSATAAR